MKLTPQTAVLRDGRACLLRSPDAEDWETMIDLLRVTAAETPYLIRYPEEIDMVPEQEQAYLRAQAESPRSIMICAFDGARALGSCGINPVGERIKLRHRCSIGIALRRECWGAGLGGQLFRIGLEQARALGFEQIELGVFEPNERAIALYKKCGFEVWGATPRAARLKGGSYLTELTMGKLL